MRRCLKNLMIAIIFVCSITCVVNAGEYFYFTGNGNGDNGFQQGCSETYDLMYNIAGYHSSASIYVKLDSNKFTYETGTYTINGAGNLFDITNNNVQFLSNSDVIAWRTHYDKAFTSFSFDNNIALAGKIGSLKFTPVYSGSDYSGNFILIYSGDNSDTVGFFTEGKNTIKNNPTDQLNNLTGEIRIVRKPCNEDTKPPVISGVNYTSGDLHVYKHDLVFDISDDEEQGLVPYAYNSTGNWVTNSRSMNNQIGVNPSSIRVVVGGNLISSNDISCVQKSGTPKTWTGWKDRDYTCTVSSGKLGNFGVEQEITITITGADRNGRVSDTESITFNTPQRPYLQSHSPSGLAQPVNSKITFEVRDAWAGVDSGSIVLRLTAPGYSRIYTGNVSSGLSLTRNSGSEGLGGAAGYTGVLTLSEEDYLPVDSTITVNLYFEDMNGYSSGAMWTFHTRQSCVALGCCDGTEIYTGLENSYISFTGENLYISGGNNPSVTTGNIEYFGSIFTGALVINCNYVGLTLFKGTPENNPTEVASVPYNRLVFTGGDNVVKGVLSGNVLTLKYYIDDAELILLQPYSGQKYRSNNNVDFQWQLSGWVGSETTRYSLYVVSSDTQPSDWGDPIYVTNDLTARVGLDNANSYRWRIVAEDGNQIEAFTGTFLVDVNSIATTTVITPINLSGTIASRTSTGLYLLDDMVLEWSVDVGQGSGDLTKFEYEVYQGNQCLGTPFATGAVDIQSQGVIPTTGQIYRLLEEGEYCWQVRVLDTNNNTSPSWTGKTFVVSNPYCAKTDSKLTLLSPENNAQLYNSDVTLRWSGNWDDCIAGQSGYHVELYSGTVGDTTDMITSGNYDSLTELLSISLSGGQYRWRVKMLSSDVEGEWKNSSFEIVSMMDPNNLINFELVLDEPVSGQNPVDRNVSFRWHVNGTGVGTLMYDINIYTGVINDTENSTLIANGVDLITTGFDRLLPNGDDYRWEVTVRDNYGNPSITEFTGSFDLNVSKNVRGVEITQISPVGSVAPGDILFEWNGNIPTDGEGVVNHYEVRVHEGDCAGDIIYTGNNLSIETTGFTTQIMEGGNYCWEIWAVDTDGYTGGRVETGFILSSEFIIKVNLGWGDGNNKSRGKFFLYESGNKDAPKYSGYVNIGTDGTGSFNEIVEPGYYDVVFKDWQYLSVYQTGQYIDGSSKIIDFTNTGITMGLDESGYLWYGDFPNIDNGNWVYSFNINSVDFGFVYGKYCMNNEVSGITEKFHRICDLNQDGRVTVDDGAGLLKFLQTSPSDLAFKEKDMGLYKGFGSLDYGIVEGLHTDDEVWSNYVSLYDNR